MPARSHVSNKLGPPTFGSGPPGSIGGVMRLIQPSSVRMSRYSAPCSDAAVTAAICGYVSSMGMKTRLRSTASVDANRPAAAQLRTSCSCPATGSNRWRISESTRAAVWSNSWRDRRSTTCRARWKVRPSSASVTSKISDAIEKNSLRRIDGWRWGRMRRATDQLPSWSRTAGDESMRGIGGMTRDRNRRGKPEQ